MANSVPTHATPDDGRRAADEEVDAMEAAMHDTVDTWTEMDGTGVSSMTVCPCLAPVSMALLDDPDTERADLM